MSPDREPQGKEHAGLGVGRSGPATSWTGGVQFGLDSPSHPQGLGPLLHGAAQSRPVSW